MVTVAAEELHGNTQLLLLSTTCPMASQMQGILITLPLTKWSQIRKKEGAKVEGGHAGGLKRRNKELIM